MDRGRFTSIVSELKQYALTEREMRFVELTAQHFAEKEILNEEQESLLEGIYREKRKWGKLLVSPRRNASRDQTLPKHGAPVETFSAS